MKHYLIPLLFSLLLVGCRNHTARSEKQDSISCERTDSVSASTGGESSEKTNNPTSQEDRTPVQRSYFIYNQPIAGYTVCGTAVWNSEFNCRDLILTFRELTSNLEFSVSGGRVFWDMPPADTLHWDYPIIERNHIITAPNQPFFFADLDFDGQNELITDISPFGGSQRDVGAFTEIYKIEHGHLSNKTEYFTKQSSIFQYMNQDYFQINEAKREILLYNDGGAINFGWEVYKFDKGKYRYDRTIRCQLESSDKYQVTILSPQNDTLRKFFVSQRELELDKWQY